MISIQNNKVTGILTVRIKASEAELAEKINQSLINELQEYINSYNKKKNIDAKNFITGRIDAVEKELSLAEESLKTLETETEGLKILPLFY